MTSGYVYPLSNVQMAEFEAEQAHDHPRLIRVRPVWLRRYLARYSGYLRAGFYIKMHHASYPLVTTGGPYYSAEMAEGIVRYASDPALQCSVVYLLESPSCNTRPGEARRFLLPPQYHHHM